VEGVDSRDRRDHCRPQQWINTTLSFGEGGLGYRECLQVDTVEASRQFPQGRVTVLANLRKDPGDVRSDIGAARGRWARQEAATLTLI